MLHEVAPPPTYSETLRYPPRAFGHKEPFHCWLHRRREKGGGIKGFSNAAYLLFTISSLSCLVPNSSTCTRSVYYQPSYSFLQYDGSVQVDIPRSVYSPSGLGLWHRARWH